MKYFILVALLLCIGCTTQPTSPRVTPSRTIRVSFEDSWDTPGWRGWQLKAISKGFTRLDPTGYRWTPAATGWDVQVRTFDAGGHCEEAGGRYELNRPFVEIDPGCVQTAEQLRFVVYHELLHWFTWREYRWVGHLCREPREARDCSVRHFGVGLLSPVLQGGTEETLAMPDASLSADDITLLQLLRGANANQAL